MALAALLLLFGARVDVSSVGGVAAQGRLLAFAPTQTTAHYGDQVTLQGELEAPAPFAGDDGREFDYPNYLRVLGISMLMQEPSIVADTAGPWSLRGALYSLKHAFEQSIQKVFAPQDAAVMQGVLLGE